MTWPMHDAGSTTPDPGREEARRQEARREPWPEETQPWPEEPWPEETSLAARAWAGSDDADPPRRGRHAAAPDPLPPIEGQMPGGGPSPAETTLPLALKWPAPPARPTRPHRSPPPGPPGAPGAPPGWRRVPRTTGYPPAAPSRVPRSPATPQGRRERPGPQGRPVAGPAGPARARARPAPRGRPRPSAPAWCGPAPAWRSAPWSRAPPASCAPSSWSTHWAPWRSATRTTTPTRCRTPSTT